MKNYRDIEEQLIKRITSKQKELKVIWESAVVSSDSPVTYEMLVRDTEDKSVIEHSFFRRGFKAQYNPSTGLYELYNIKGSDYYKHASNKLIDTFYKKGFRRAVDEEKIKSSRRKLKSYDKKINEADQQRNDAWMVHWKKKRRELLDEIILIEEHLNYDV